MSKRNHMGPRNGSTGQIGIYISQPGEDVFSTTKSLLLDSRYDYLKLHYQARIQLTRGTRTAPPAGAGGSPGYRYYALDVPFPGLPYYPMHACTLLFTGSQTVWYPPPWPNWDVGNSNKLQIVNFVVKSATAGLYDRVDIGTFQAADQGKFSDVDAIFSIYKMPLV